MLKQKLNQRGFAHGGLAVLAVFTVFAIGLVGYNVSQNQVKNSDVLGSSTHKTKKLTKKVNKKGRISPGGSVQFVVVEQVTDSKGKKTTQPRGNVNVVLTATNKNQACRDAGKIYQRLVDTVFSGNTDADKSHAKNLGKIKIDNCLVGKYTARLVLSDKYVFVGAKSKDVTVKKGVTKKVTFTVAKKPGTPAGNPQGTDTIPTPAPAPTPSVAISDADVVKAIDTTNYFENDMFYDNTKTCEPKDDLGEVVDIRKAAFAKHASSYMAPALITKVNNTYSGDAFQLLGLSNYICAQYEVVDIKEHKPASSNGSPTSVTITHEVIVKARTTPTQGYTKGTTENKTWVYTLTKVGSDWKISSIEVK